MAILPSHGFQPAPPSTDWAVHAAHIAVESGSASGSFRKASGLGHNIETTMMRLVG